MKLTHAQEAALAAFRRSNGGGVEVTGTRNDGSVVVVARSPFAKSDDDNSRYVLTVDGKMLPDEE